MIPEDFLKYLRAEIKFLTKIGFIVATFLLKFSLTLAETME
ncbi:hypothetical protein [Borreliella bavariensis]|nr:hypothetical protein [Borreliella bavariensis]